MILIKQGAFYDGVCLLVKIKINGQPSLESVMHTSFFIFLNLQTSHSIVDSYFLCQFEQPVFY